MSTVDWIYPSIVPQSKYLPAKLWPMNLWLSFISDWIESVIWISPPWFFVCLDNFLNIDTGKIYLPITALLDGALCIEGFSITAFIKKLFLSIVYGEL